MTQRLDTIRRESRELLMHTALQLFASRGYGSTSVRSIAQAAGVSQGLLYNYFESKEALLRAIFRRGMASVEESFGRIADDGPPLDQLEGLVRGSIEIVRRDEAFWRFFYALRFQAEAIEDLGDTVQIWSTRILTTLGSLLARAGVRNVRGEARVLFAIIDGMAQHSLLEIDGYPVEEAVAAVLDRYRLAARD